MFINRGALRYTRGSNKEKMYIFSNQQNRRSLQSNKQNCFMDGHFMLTNQEMIINASKFLNTMFGHRSHLRSYLINLWNDCPHQPDDSFTPNRHSKTSTWLCATLFLDTVDWYLSITLQCRHNGHTSVSNHQPQYCLLNRFSASLTFVLGSHQ